MILFSSVKCTCVAEPSCPLCQWQQVNRHWTCPWPHMSFRLCVTVACTVAMSNEILLKQNDQEWKKKKRLKVYKQEICLAIQYNAFTNVLLLSVLKAAKAKFYQQAKYS